LKICLRVLISTAFLNIYLNCDAQKSFVIIQKKTGKLNLAAIHSLTAPLKGMAAFYSAMGGTECGEGRCGLTSALGLGNQGSEAQKKLILQYFPDDKAVKLVTGQDCYLPPTGSSSFSTFKYLSFIVYGDEVQVNYELDVISPGKVKKINGPDIYTFKNQIFKNKSRVLYAWTGK
jgi:hypothetical protein